MKSEARKDMKNENDELNTILNSLQSDPDFARRTAKAILKKADPQRRLRQGFLGAAAAVFAAAFGLLMYLQVFQEKDGYEGFTPAAAQSLISDSETSNFWSETDGVINSALAER